MNLNSVTKRQRLLLQLFLFSDVFCSLRRQDILLLVADGPMKKLKRGEGLKSRVNEKGRGRKRFVPNSAINYFMEQKREKGKRIGWQLFNKVKKLVGLLPLSELEQNARNEYLESKMPLIADRVLKRRGNYFASPEGNEAQETEMR